jgi:transcriptional regulator with XRE-family HTH domain
MTFDFTKLKQIATVAGLAHLELAQLLKITRPTFYLWARGGKPQTLASYEAALKVLRAVRRALDNKDFPVSPDLRGEERAAEIAKRYSKNYVAE